MKKVALVGVDSAGGVIKGGGQSFFTVNGHPVAVLGDAVEPHDRDEHRSATMVEASGKLTINGIHVVLEGDAASCGHLASGSGFLQM